MKASLFSVRRWAGLVGSALLAAMTLQAHAYSNLVVFGDSLSDSGNNAQILPPDPSYVLKDNSVFSQHPYFGSNTYSNGQVWTQYLAPRLGLSATASLLGGSNYAFGGAQTGQSGPGPGGFPYSLHAQLGMYLGAVQGKADANALYVVAGGGNNVRESLGAVLSGTVDPTAEADRLAKSFASDVGQIVDSLQAAGARHILVWNTPNFGLTPQARSYGAQGMAVATSFSQAMNGALVQRLAGEQGVKSFDVYGLLTSIVAQGATSGFSDVINACGAPSLGCDASTSFFYDAIHPTTLAHKVLADSVYASVVPEPASAMLMCAGLCWLMGRTRRTAAARRIP